MPEDRKSGTGNEWLTGTFTARATGSGTITTDNAKIVDADGKNVTGNYALTCADGVLEVKDNRPVPARRNV